MELSLQRMDSCIRLMTSLQTRELHWGDICRILALDTFASYQVAAVMIFKLNADGSASLVESFGLPDECKYDSENISIIKNLPSTFVFRINDLIGLPTKKSIEKEFPILSKFRGVPKYSSLYSLPIRKFGAPVGAVIIFGEQLPMDSDIERHLELLGLMLATRFLAEGKFSRGFEPTIVEGELNPVLTKREKLIQIGMAKGLTNAQIALELGYSESTIRQSAVEIFTKLEVTNRVDAGKLLEDI